MKPGYPRGGWSKLPREKQVANHRKIVELREKGIPLTKIAKQVNTTYGSVTYVLYRKKDNQLWK